MVLFMNDAHLVQADDIVCQRMHNYEVIVAEKFI